MGSDHQLTTNPEMCTECGDRPANTGGSDPELCVECDPEQGGA